MSRIRGPLTLLVACIAAIGVSNVASAASLVTRPVGAAPLSDNAAAKRVKRSSFEPRPENAAQNRRIPTKAELAEFHRRSDMPYQRYVSGRYRGTTDEILQWAARKWGFDPDLFRAVATVESWWRMSTLVDNGD